MYTHAVGNIKAHHSDAKYIVYADDKELYLIFDLCVSEEVITSMEPLIANI